MSLICGRLQLTGNCLEAVQLEATESMDGSVKDALNYGVRVQCLDYVVS